MLLYEMFAIGIAVVLVVAATGGFAARVMMAPEETALLRLARTRTSPAPPCSLSSPAGAGRASRSSPAPPVGRNSPAG
jgi:hypothetical protein